MNKSSHLFMIDLKHIAFIAATVRAAGLIVMGWCLFAQFQEPRPSVKHETAAHVSPSVSGGVIRRLSRPPSAKSPLDGFRHAEVVFVSDTVEQITALPTPGKFRAGFSVPEVAAWSPSRLPTD